jgi:hypothetical protein
MNKKNLGAKLTGQNVKIPVCATCVLGKNQIDTGSRGRPAIATPVV